jgi:hypothetical protein
VTTRPMPRVVPGASAPDKASEEAARRGQIAGVRPETDQRAGTVVAFPGNPRATQHGDVEGAQAVRRPPPLLDEATRRQHCCLLADTANAARMREEGRGLGIFHDPRGLAKYNNFQVCPQRDDDEPTTASCIFLTWHSCQRERGIRVLCGLARAYLLREQITHNFVDVWLMALELAVPHGALLAGVDRVVARHRHCPEHIIRSLVVPTY